MPKKLTTFSMRMPEDINERIQAYAAEHECTKAEAMSHFVRAGIDLEDNGPTTPEAVDLSALTERLDGLREAAEKSTAAATEARDVARQAVENTKPSETSAIVPADIRERVAAYAEEHSCTEEEALGYFARLGVGMTAEQQPATAKDLADLSKKLDALAADGAAKNEQLKSLMETVAQIKGYTEPESVELEGEIADPAIEEAKDALEEERREAERDEHTRKIINEVMDSYLEKSKPAEPASAQGASQTSVLMAVLAAAVVALVIGIVVILLVQR